MHRTLKALMVAALASGALLLVATLGLDAWHWRLYKEEQALQFESAESDAVVVEDPYESLPTSAITYLQIFIACCSATTFWAVFVVIPSLLVSRRVFTGAIAGHIVAAIVVCAVSGIAFALMQRVTPYISPLIPFSVGGAIGLLSVLLLAKMLPPNTSFERTR
jgi:hypothetical protein